MGVRSRVALRRWVSSVSIFLPLLFLLSSERHYKAERSRLLAPRNSFTLSGGSWIRRSLNENVDLLAYVKRDRGPIELVDDLQNASVHPLRAVAREGLLWNDVRFDAHETKRQWIL